LPDNLAECSEQEIDVQAPLMGFVDDDDVVPKEQRILAELGQEHAVGQNYEAGSRRSARLEAHLKADGLAGFGAEFMGDARGDAACCDAPWLRVSDRSVNAEAGFEQHLRQLGGLARAGGCTDDQHLMRTERLMDPIVASADGQLNWVSEGERVGASGCSHIARTLNRQFDGTVQLAVRLALSSQTLVVAQLPPKRWQVCAQALGEARLEHRESAGHGQSLGTRVRPARPGMSSSVAESHIDALRRCHGVRWVYLHIMELALSIRCRKPAMAVLLATASAFGEGCPGDLDNNGIADGADLGILLSSWGVSGGMADIDQNGVVDGADLGILLSSWGPCVSVPEWGSLIEAMPDPAVIYDAGIRQAIIATGSAWRVRDNLTGMEMILVPGGSFEMGCPTETGCYADEYPRHPVTISASFYIGRYEVTQSQWVARMNYNPSYFQPPQFPGSMDRPVDWVSWNNIQSFLSITGMNLPTEAQWEYAARAGTTTTYHGTASQPGGSNDPSILPSIAWFGMAPGDPVYGTQVGGLKLANGFGLHDMTGNVWEWVRDRYAADYYSYSPIVDPTGPASGGYRPIRGGGCGYDADSCRISARGEGPAGFAHGMIGFRVTRPNDQ